MDIEVQFDYPKNMPWLLPIVNREFEEFLTKAAKGQLAEYGRQMVLADAIATGRSFKSFQISQVEQAGDRHQISLAPVGDQAKVIEWMELGRRPNKSGNPSDAMVANIRTWLIEKGIYSESSPKRDLRTASWAIAAAIAQEGLEPRFILDKAQRQYKPNITRMFEAACRRIAVQINKHLARS